MSFLMTTGKEVQQDVDLYFVDCTKIFDSGLMLCSKYGINAEDNKRKRGAKNIIVKTAKHGSLW